MPSDRRRRRRAGRRGVDLQLRQRLGAAAFAIVAVTVVGSVLAVGAVHPQVVLALTPLALAAGALAVTRDGLSSLWGPPAVFIALATYTLLQSAPMPLGLLRALDAETASIWASAMQPFAGQVGWASLSLDPGATRLEAVKWLAYAAVFLVGASVTRSRDARWVPALIFGSALLLALVTLAHRFAGADKVFGLYQPWFAAPRFAMSPLLNPNNLAGYLNLGAFAGLGSMVARRPIAPRWLFGLGAAIIVAVSAAAASRAGVVSLAIGGVATMVALAFGKFEGSTLSRSVLLAAGLAMVSGSALFLLGADRAVWQALTEEEMRKLSLISWTKPMVFDHFWFGVGRGTFETAFSAYRADVGHHVYQFAENFVTQWCSEWGVPIALGAIGLLTWQLRPARLGLLRSPTAMICAIGVGVLLIHNSLDLGLELASIGFALSAMLGSLWGGRDGRGSSSSFSPSFEGWKGKVVPVALAGLAVVTWLGALLAGPSAIEERRLLSQRYKALRAAQVAKQPDPEPTLRADIQAAVRRHPADPFPPLIGALTARAHGENALPWIARAIERDPMAGRPYLLLAQVLAERGAVAQALPAVAMAVEREYGLVKRAAVLAGSMTQDADKLLRSAPQGPGGAGLLTALATQAQLQGARSRLLEEAIRRDPDVVRAREHLAGDLLAAAAGRESPCEPPALEQCLARAKQLATTISKLQPNLDRGMILLARVKSQQGDKIGALRGLEAGCQTLSAPVECLRWQVRLAQEAHDLAALERGAEAYLGIACNRAHSCAAAATWLGDRYLAAGEKAKALRLFERAAEEGDSAGAWQRVAALSTKLGLPSSAARAKQRAKRASGAVEPPTDGPAQIDSDVLNELLDD